MDWQQNDSVTLTNTGHPLPGWGGGDGLQPHAEVRQDERGRGREEARGCSSGRCTHPLTMYRYCSFFFWLLPFRGSPKPVSILQQNCHGILFLWSIFGQTLYHPRLSKRRTSYEECSGSCAPSDWQKQCLLAQGHLDMWTGGGGWDKTTTLWSVDTVISLLSHRHPFTCVPTHYSNKKNTPLQVQVLQ